MTTSGPFSLHQTFVGREAELDQLTNAFERAVAGSGSVAMVVGEPGIGKTTICERFAEHVREQGGCVLVGHCYEEGSLSLPYLPFVEAIRSYVLATDATELRDVLGGAAPRLARIVPEVRDRIDVDGATAADPEEELYRLMQAVSDVLRGIGSRTPLFLMLEDLHDADRATLSLLTHLARTVGDSRVVIVGTYRDVEVDRAHPLSSALADLRRVTTFSRVPLRGLTPDEVHRMLNGMTGQEVRWGLASTVHRQTEGNPLFVQEVLRYLAQAGIISQQGGRWQRIGDEPPEMSIPEGLRDVIGKRLSGLSDQCNRVLSVASVTGRDFRLDVLQAVSGLAEDALFEALSEARAAAVVEERSSIGAVVMYRFTHAFFQQTLYEEMIAPQRIRLHQRVARALEQIYAGRLEEHAAELAEHTAYSADPVDLAKAVAYGRMAARRAADVYAFGEEARQLDQAIKVQEVLDPDDRATRCDLLLDLGGALISAGEAGRSLVEVVPAAFDLAESIGDDARASRSAQIAFRGIDRHRTLTVPSDELNVWTERANRYAEEGTLDRAYADVLLGTQLLSEGKNREAWPWFERALDLAERLGDAEALLIAARLAFLGSPEQPAKLLQLTERLREWPRAGASANTVGLTLWAAILILLGVGQRSRAAEFAREVAEIAERNQSPSLVWRPLAFEMMSAYFDGELERGCDLATQVVNRANELGEPMMAVTYGQGLAVRPLMWLGRFEAASVSLATGYGPLFNSMRLVGLAVGGDRANAERELGEWFERHRVSGRSTLYHPTFLEAAVLLDAVDIAAQLTMDIGEPPMPLGYGAGFTSPSRHIAAAAALSGDFSTARERYRRAADECTAIPHRPEAALARLGLAEVLADHFPDEQAEAAQHLETAIAEFRAMKMQPSLEKALALQARLAGKSVPAEYPDGISEREVDVLRLIASGKTDREIAKELFISVRTVGTHVSNILGKIDAANRTEAASYATRHGLV